MLNCGIILNYEVSDMKKINIITGHYGSGKTNFSANTAMKLAHSGEKVTVVDLDIVNPYFRTADFTELFGNNNIELIKPMYANTNLDIPAISFDLERIATDDGYLVIDVGGDDDGALALGRYSEAFKPFLPETEFYYVVNRFRYIDDGVDECAALLSDIESASRMTATQLVNNSNLGCETTADNIREGIAFAEKVAEKTGLPLYCTTCPDTIRFDGEAEYNHIYVKPLWDVND